jgi:hypothetical protein
VRRVRWAFHDISVEGIIKLIAQAAAERYKALMMTEVRANSRKSRLHTLVA